MVGGLGLEPSLANNNKIATIPVTQDREITRRGTNIEILFLPQGDLFFYRPPNFSLVCQITAAGLDDKRYVSINLPGKEIRPFGMIKYRTQAVFFRLLPHRTSQTQPEIDRLERIKRQDKL